MSDYTKMSTEELEARKAELLAELNNQEMRDALSAEDLESKKQEILDIDAELKSRKEAAKQAEETRQEVAEGHDPVIKDFEEKRYQNMERNSMEYRDLWLRNLQGNLTEEEKRAYTTTGDGATNAIPTILSEKFFEKMKKLAPMLSEITLFRVAGNLKFVAEGVRNPATAKHVENSAQAASADTTVSVSLSGFEFLKNIQISRTARLMSVDAFENWLIEMLAGDIARAIDNYILNDATNGIAAITYTTNTNQLVVTTYEYGDICDLIALLPAAYDAEAKFLVNKKTLYSTIAQIEDSVGRPIFVPDTITGIGGRLMGFPVVVDDYVSSDNGALYLGKWTDVVGNLPEDINVASDESAGFTANSVIYRGVAVFDSKPAKTDGIVRLVSTTA